MSLEFVTVPRLQAKNFSYCIIFRNLSTRVIENDNSGEEEEKEHKLSTLRTRKIFVGESRGEWFQFNVNRQSEQLNWQIAFFTTCSSDAVFVEFHI